MIEIDGSSGGGQMLRSALTLSAVTGESFQMENIRGSRSDPGLKRQHLEAVKAAGRLCGADLQHAELGSEKLDFRPGKLKNESFTVNIGTAGSVTLLLDTVVPITTQFSSDFRLNVKGGTDVKWSPTLDYIRQVKLPLLRKYGFRGSSERKKTGYYPSGGGEVVLNTEEFSMDPVDVRKRGELQRFELYSRASRELESQNVADRQADELERKLKNSHISVPVEKSVEYEKTDSTGSSLVLKSVYRDTVAGFESLGERGKRSEDVAGDVLRDFRSFHSGNAAVDPYMADQLVIFLAIVGGEILVPELSSHVRTNVGVVRKFGRDVEIIDKGRETVLRRA